MLHKFEANTLNFLLLDCCFRRLLKVHILSNPWRVGHATVKAPVSMAWVLELPVLCTTVHAMGASCAGAGWLHTISLFLLQASHLSGKQTQTCCLFLLLQCCTRGVIGNQAIQPQDLCSLSSAAAAALAHSGRWCARFGQRVPCFWLPANAAERRSHPVTRMPCWL